MTGAGRAREQDTQRWPAWVIGALFTALACVSQADATDAVPNRIRKAPEFELLTQDATALKSAELGGKVLVVAFIYTTCPLGCSPLTARLAEVQRRLRPEHKPAVHFALVTLNPAVDNPDALRRFARVHDLDTRHVSLLTGSPEAVKSLATDFGVVSRRLGDGEIEHTFLTTIVDREGYLRVQYSGLVFDLAELQRDLERVVDEGR